MAPKGSKKGKKKVPTSEPTSISSTVLENGIELNSEVNGNNYKSENVTESAPDEKIHTDEISEEDSAKAPEKKSKRTARKVPTKEEVELKVSNHHDSVEEPPAKKPKAGSKKRGAKNQAKSPNEENGVLSGESEEEKKQEELVVSYPKRERKTVMPKVPEEPKKAGNVAKGKRGRKQNKNTVEEEHCEELKPEELEDAKNVQVNLVREPHIDNMAVELQESEDTKVKSAAGTSGKGRGRKRAAEDTSSGSAPKKDKAEGTKRTQKAKIPDVSALDFENKSTNADGNSWNLKIATWNVNGLRAWVEKDGLSYLHTESPDILCLQETKCSEDKIPEECNPLGYHCFWLAGDKDGYSGVGLMSKEKPESVEYGIGKKTHDNEGRVITAEYEKFYLVATYVPNAGRKLVRLEYRQQWDIDFKAYLKKLDKIKPVILCGDLNVAHDEIDLANPKTNKKNAGFTQEERDGFSALLSEGFIDAFRHLYPDQKDAYTFWTYMMNARAKNVGWRLDYFVLSKRFGDNLCDCVIRKDVMGSDHCPLVLFLQI